MTASDKYFGRYTNHLFFDPRVRVLAEDGRNYLRATREGFDIIISDLFVPWKAGVGGLYSLEHYQTILQRLNHNGLFMQWLPAYQLTRSEFDVIAGTMLKAFPQVTVWRAGFSPLTPVIGLMGHKNERFLSPGVQLFKYGKQDFLRNYAGNLEAMRQRLQTVPLNTDDKPVIEFGSPISQRLIKSGAQKWLVGDELVRLLEALQDSEQPYLSAMPESMQKMPRAGMHLQRAQLLKYQGKLAAAKLEMDKYKKLIRASE